MDVSQKIKSLIAYNLENEDISFDKEYQKTFENEGLRKSEYILNILSSNNETAKEDFSEYLLVSIGGADGSEAEHLLKSTKIKKAILVEISDSAANAAKEKSKEILDKYGKELRVMQGDLTQRLEELIREMNDFKNTANNPGLVLSMQAVLHELPKRSPGFRLSVFFGQIFSVFNKNVFFAREPIRVERWPEIVEVKVGNATSGDLVKLANIINDKLSIAELETTAIANGYINIDSTLAVELLHKLIRSNSVNNFKYELGEQLTSIDTAILQKTIESHLGAATVTIEPTVTEGFKEAWRLHEVDVKDEHGSQLSFPNTHARIVAISINKQLPNDISKISRRSKRREKNEKQKSEINTISNRTDIRNYYRDNIEGVKSRFYVYGVGLGGFAGEYRELIQKKIREGVDVKILSLSPREEIFQIYFENQFYSLLGWKDFESGNGGKAQNDSKYLQDWVFEENLKILKEGGEKLIELRFYSSLPVGAIMIVDDTIFYSPSLVNNSDDNTTMVFEKEDKPYDKFNRYFDDLWASLNFSQSAIDTHILHSFNDRGCLIQSLRKRRRYKFKPEEIVENYGSFVDHAKHKLLYNELAPLFLQASSRNTKKEIEFIRSMEHVRGEAVEYIVDLGCGVGRHATILSAYYKVTAIDISETEIEIASKTKGAIFQVGDIRDWDTAEKPDLVICMWSTLNYLSTANDLDKFIDSCNRNMDDTGVLVLDLKNPTKVINKSYKRRSYSYPYEINLKIDKKVINKNVLNAIYTYDIKNLQTGESVYVTDQEINKKYELEDIRIAFSRSFSIEHVYGDYSTNSAFDDNSDRMIIVLKKISASRDA
ncbi:class I SAM-dependent methyltransferase [Granulosicoccus antarcticus]|uniref:dTDP-3-amino-3,4, 6-trideoxy-alpha-D-glucopyranose n=1 Tax=Granulosicoccus antarcticus IMCC3135 TaxID=1192854 RepID=A0A2Z2P7F3_9GAMM|nr:class I SAM-dependent methyltransferase [Granulosicoccus antarcticus]ASJ75774.1 dTDP-3-amino-3,4,6-trideoxy-alpha-D-glucopyranose [Granulosicoccus antarcticus IMCC3135]